MRLGALPTFTTIQNLGVTKLLEARGGRDVLFAVARGEYLMGRGFIRNPPTIVPP